MSPEKVNDSACISSVIADFVLLFLSAHFPIQIYYEFAAPCNWTLKRKNFIAQNFPTSLLPHLILMHVWRLGKLTQSLETWNRADANCSSQCHTCQLAISGEVLCAKASQLCMLHRTWNFPKHGNLTF
jgi:hypothetical protein